MRQVDVPALHQPHERHDRGLPRHGPAHHRRPRHLCARTSIRSSCARASAWCSRSRTRSRSRSSTTSPMARASTALPPTKPELDAIVAASLRQGRAVGRGQGPPRRSGHGPFRRPAAAAVHRARHRRRSRDHPDGRAVLGARSDRHRPHRGADRGAAADTTASSSSRTRSRRPRASRSAQRSSTSAISSRRGRPSRSSRSPRDQRTQDYITGRFG